MRLHRNLVYAVIDGLDKIFNEKEYADKVVEKLLKRDKRWGARDRAFIAETIYEIVRWKRLYTVIAAVNPPYNRDNLWRVFAVWAVLRGHRLPDWKQLEGTPVRRIKGKFDELSQTRKYRESIPDWLDELGVQELGEELWEKEIHALNEQANVILRVNTLKTDKKTLKKSLAEEHIHTQELKGLPDALVLEERANVFKTEAFKNGWFEVQDASSQLVAPFLQPEPGMRVIDTCAGAGGKTLHLASLMENKGQIVAMDIYGNKLHELKRRSRRNGAHNIETRVIENSKTIKKLHGKADRVLIDAPCSGLGVLRRNPDAKWKLQPEFLQQIRQTQQEILQDYSKMVKDDGLLVYATCSILPSENHEQVKTFLNTDQGKQFELVKDKKILASQSGFDGFYMALLKKKPTK
ncbi:methyltransferase domain-containing protein [Robertkochia marina]|uniref:Methyltransferase domain-containing protein n=1 Tax=Robertkochia marina TaxID=1227945 RepID=A0A4S3M0F4_9FLAO|nr:methyltransferase domain-containing protein [Robertkochia marina]THD67443.1 methyltransferase domain-containing protein [Robertkochia marina]TRZ44702.1 methyltransferase domain-containing protein [Robertkochia marina]